MKSKIVALSKNQDFKNLLKERKIYNKYTTIYFGKLLDKNKIVGLLDRLVEHSALRLDCESIIYL